MLPARASLNPLPWLASARFQVFETLPHSKKTIRDRQKEIRMAKTARAVAARVCRRITLTVFGATARIRDDLRHEHCHPVAAHMVPRILERLLVEPHARDRNATRASNRHAGHCRRMAARVEARRRSRRVYTTHLGVSCVCCPISTPNSRKLPRKESSRSFDGARPVADRMGHFTPSVAIACAYAMDRVCENLIMSDHEIFAMLAREIGDE